MAGFDLRQTFNGENRQRSGHGPNGSADAPTAPTVDTIVGVNELATWPPRRWITAFVAALAVALAVGLPTDVIPNPVFGRPVDVTWWSYPVLIVTAVLSGLLVATYVRLPGSEPMVTTVQVDDEIDTPGKDGGLGGLLSFFAVGCPTCNKLAVIALGSTGALDWFAPAQPMLAVLSLVLLVWALRARLRSASVCRIAT